MLRGIDCDGSALNRHIYRKFALPFGHDFLVPNKMKPAKKIRAKKHRGRPSTAQGVQIGPRWPEVTVVQIDAWASQQGDTPAPSEPIRRLLNIGLAKPAPAVAVPSAAKASSERAREMA